MDIKEKATRYERAEITIVALNKKETDKYYNLYSVVELCPKDQMKSAEFGNKTHPYIREKLNNEYNVFIRRVFLDKPLRGIDFFQSKGLRAIYESKQLKDDVIYDYDEMVCEPDGEEGILFNSDSADRNPLKPVLPEFPGSVRVYTQLCKSDKLLNLLSQADWVKAGLFIKKELGISLLDNMEYWGSVFLCLPNPFIRSLELSLGRDGKYLLVNILPRQWEAISGGIFEITDQRHLGTGFCHRKVIDSTQFVIDMPNEPEKLIYRIYTPSGELIAETASCFMKSVSLQISTFGQRRFFQIKDNVTEITMMSHQHITVGKNSQDAYLKRLTEEENKRNLKELEKSRTFIYFPGNNEDPDSKAKAEYIIKEIIGKAQNKCIICDPYFSSNDFLTYGIMVTSLGLTLHLVTSEMFLIQPLAKEETRTQGDALLHILKQLKNKTKVECHVLEGRKSSPLHDRFIIADDNAYLLGSSLSEFGSRATTLFKVPNPEALDKRARKWIYNQTPSISLEDWAIKNKL